jgi:hypothetical protein
MRQFGELEAVIMDRLWEWGRAGPLGARLAGPAVA